MPIQFRCHHCRQVLSITSRNAGKSVTCPACVNTTRVPTVAEVQAALAEKKARSSGSPAGDSARQPVPRKKLPSEELAPVPHERHVESSGPAATTDEEATELWRAAAVERNPWIDEEADEEDDFQISKPPLEESGLDMTPMVDVTFLLLIFFMITAAFSIQKSMQAEPPQPDEEGAAQTMTIEEMEQDSVIVGISQNDELTVDDEPVGGLSGLADRLRARASEGGGNLEMTIEADPRCSFGIMVGVMDTGITAGMQKIRRVSLPVDE